ncbi:MAG TPA: protein kinase [Holophagaceae bacterium]|nr:protein kinase [Holophagaceae bacterium]
MAQPVRWHHSLAWRFFLRTGLVILLLVGAVMGVALVLGGQVARRSAREGLLSAGKILEKSFAEQARVMDAGLEVFTQYSANQANIETAVQTGDSISVRDTLLDNLSRLNADVAVVVRPTGMQFSCTTDAYKHDYTDVGIVQMAMHPEEAAAQAGQKGPSYIGFFEIEGGAFKGVYHGVTRRIVTPGGEFIGVMLVGTKLDAKTAGLLKNLALPRTEPPGQLGLLSHFRLLGDTFTAGDARRGMLDKALASDPAFEKAKDMVRKGEVTDPVAIRLGGADYLATLTPLRGANALDLEVSQLLLMPLDPFLAPFRKLQAAILGVGAVGLLLALVIALGAARSVSRPLSRLTEATAALAEGQRPEIPALRTQDEVGYLTQAFQALLSELKAKEDLLAALEEVRAERGETRPMESRVGMTVVDMDATINIGTRSGSSPMARPTRRLTLKEGEVFGGRYRIEGIVGKGGMGVVLKAHDEQLDEEVALKVIRPEHAVDESFLEQLKQEIKLARRITHKYVLRTHDYGDAEGVPFVSMEYLRGVTLKQLLDDRGRLPLPLVLRIGRQVAEGLEAAHAEGVVHRDIKPLNVLFDARGDVKLMDFGLAAPVAAAGTDKEGQVFGTPRYMAPEQVRGERVDPRTDLYSLGIMLFELASGTPPFDDADVTHLMRMHLTSPVPSVRSAVPDLPSAFAYLLERLMAKRMEDRPSSAAEVVETLKLIAAGGGADTRRG